VHVIDQATAIELLVGHAPKLEILPARGKDRVRAARALVRRSTPLPWPPWPSRIGFDL
jgi:hypothetical protein